MKKLLIIISLFASHIGHAEAPKILSLKAQAAVIDRLLEEKVATVLPQLMRNNGIDMWIVMAREYNEDPVIRTLLPAIWHAARRRTVLVMFDQGIDDRHAVLAPNPSQHHVTGMPFHQRCDLAVVATE